MKTPGRIAAAIEILDKIEAGHLPAKLALKEWGRANRYAGSRDRSVIANLVYDALRNKQTLAWRMGDLTPRSLVLATAVFIWGESLDQLAASFIDDRFAPEPLIETELERLSNHPETELPIEAQLNLPDWLVPNFKEVFGNSLLDECTAFAARAPIDIRVNSLKADPAKLTKALKKFRPQATPYAPTALRIAPARPTEKNPALEAELSHAKGWFEIQDEASQLAALLTGAAPGDQVLDYCAGAGGKTLALAAQMQNKGQVHAYDTDKHRLQPIIARLKRAGVRNAQVYDAGNDNALAPLAGKMDIVLIDSPCSGTGTWRRHPDAKWRLTEAQLNERMDQQQEVLAKAARFVRPGGRLIYVTCSVLREENQQQLEVFLGEHTEFQRLAFTQFTAYEQTTELAKLLDADKSELLLTPATTGTDGFFIASMLRGA